MTRIALCFFGITRSLPYTNAAIFSEVIEPCRARGETRVFGHFFNMKRIENQRSGESIEVSDDHYGLLPFDHLQKEEPELFLPQTSFEQIKQYGDEWSDGFQSLKNLYHQLHSIQQVYIASKAFAPDLTLFVRPDLLYMDSFAKTLDQVIKVEAQDYVVVPSWQSFGGMNDRFAIARGAGAEVLGNRIALAPDFCSTLQRPLHGESLVNFALKRAGVQVGHTQIRAMRVRANGKRAKEFFGDSLLARLIGRARYYAQGTADRVGLGLRTNPQD